MSFAASQLSTIVSLRPSSPATGADSKFVRGVTFDGITFAHSTTTYLAEKYTVPSAGDWSILPKGAVTMSEGVIGVSNLVETYFKKRSRARPLEAVPLRMLPMLIMCTACNASPMSLPCVFVYIC